MKRLITFINFLRRKQKKIASSNRDTTLANMLVNHIMTAEEKPTAIKNGTQRNY